MIEERRPAINHSPSVVATTGFGPCIQAQSRGLIFPAPSTPATVEVLERRERALNKNAARSAADDRTRAVLALVGKIALIIFAVELAIMVALDALQPSITPFVEDVVDAVVLTLVASPIIYLAVAKPFVERARIANTRLQDQLKASGELLGKNVALQASLRDASNEVALAHERVLQKVSADLHDGPAQLLAYVMLRFDALAKLATKLGKSNEDMSRIKGVLSDAIGDLRAISKGLALPQLSDLSLEEIVKLAVAKNGEIGGPRVEVELREAPSNLTIVQKACVFRIVQEALSNARKHSGAALVHILADGTQDLRIEISDNGIGLSEPQTPGLGISGMKARVQALGGELAISNREHGGTTVVATMPAC